MNNINKKLLECIHYWNNALRLNDWDLSLEQAEPGELEAMECRARVDMRPYQREAVVILRDLSKFDEATENELVHEFLHCVLAQYSLMVGKQNEGMQLSLEQAINTLGILLVRLRRDGNTRRNDHLDSFKTAALSAQPDRKKPLPKLRRKGTVSAGPQARQEVPREACQSRNEAV